MALGRYGRPNLDICPNMFSFWRFSLEAKKFSAPKTNLLIYWFWVTMIKKFATIQKGGRGSKVSLCRIFWYLLQNINKHMYSLLWVRGRTCAGPWACSPTTPAGCSPSPPSNTFSSLSTALSTLSFTVAWGQSISSCSENILHFFIRFRRALTFYVKKICRQESAEIPFDDGIKTEVLFLRRFRWVYFICK